MVSPQDVRTGILGQGENPRYSEEFLVFGFTSFFFVGRIQVGEMLIYIYIDMTEVDEMM